MAGCWFGVNPTNPTKSGVVLCANWLTFPATKATMVPPAGDATPRPHFQMWG